MCESVTGLFMGREVAWTVDDLHCRIRSGVTAAKAIKTNALAIEIRVSYAATDFVSLADRKGT